MGMFTLNEKDVNFMVKTIGIILEEKKYDLLNIQDLKFFNLISEEIFIELANKMLQSEDYEIKIDLARKLMFEGFKTFNGKVSASMEYASKTMSGVKNE